MATSLTIRFSAQLREDFTVACAELTVATRGVTVLFGPSGAGKSTFLRILAGLHRPDTGEIHFDDETWYSSETGHSVPPEKRGIGLVTQEDTLFPHLTVLENVTYGMTATDRSQKRRLAGTFLERLAITRLSDAYPAKLSGGERQRVALARALASRPRLLLLDEPFSALDLPTRSALQHDLAELLSNESVPAILVTHSSHEALALGDHAIIIANGNILQSGAMEDVFSRPTSPEVARIVGAETIVACRLIAIVEDLVEVEAHGVRLHALATAISTGDNRAWLTIRAEDVILEPPSAHATSARNRLRGSVIRVEPDGMMLRVILDVGFPLTARITRRSADELGIRPGQVAMALIKAPSIHLILQRIRGSGAGSGAALDKLDKLIASSTVDRNQE